MNVRDELRQTAWTRLLKLLYFLEPALIERIYGQEETAYLFRLIDALEGMNDEARRSNMNIITTYLADVNSRQ